MIKQRFVTFVLICLSLPHGTAAGDFRVLTTVKSPAHQKLLQTVTLFWGSQAYDFEHGKQADSEIMIIDREGRSLTLLSPQLRKKTTVDFSVLERLSDAASAKAKSARHSPIVRFAAQPLFKQQWNVDEQRLELQSRLITYIARLQMPPDAEAALAYREFADVSARLATLTPGLPPQARLKLNAAIVDLGRLPLEVKKDIEGSVYTSHHQYAWQLRDEDVNAVAEINQWVIDAQEMGFGEYLSQHRQ